MPADSRRVKRHYPKGDYHRVYVGEIIDYQKIIGVCQLFLFPVMDVPSERIKTLRLFKQAK